MLKVMVACGCGMGTSQIMKTRAQQVLKELGIQATIHHTSLDEAQSIANDFDLIIIMLGTNDVLNNIDFSNQKTADVLKIYVEECRAKFGKDKPKILLVSPILINDNCLTHPIFKDLYSEKSIEKSTHFSEYISKLADEEDTYFMNAANYAKASDIDGIHMVPEEHKKLANAFADKIKEILS